MGDAVETVIVGGGISGICIAIQLLKAGRDGFIVVEKSAEAGGTWSANKYPGCACDVPSHLYSFSFDPNPSWSQMYAERQEIHDYLNDCARRHGILSHFRFQTLARAAAWDEAAALWHVEVQDCVSSQASTISAKFLVHAIGSLHVPKLPNIQGMHRFTGSSFHSSSWDSSVDLHGKSVAIIGTGASAIQIVPSIVAKVEKLYVCQRTPAWILPKPNFTIANQWKVLFKMLPLLRWLFSWFIYLCQEVFVCAFVGRLRISKVGEWIAKCHLKRTIKDEHMRNLLLPKYELGCKRVLKSNTFYQALICPNVELVSDSILEIDEHNISLGEKSHGSKAIRKKINVDIIVYATGFDRFSPNFEVRGSRGQDLTQAGSSSFLGITKQGFPNFFMLLGPNTFLGHTSLILMVEAQVRYILSCMKLVTSSFSSMELCGSSELSYQEFLACRFENTVWRHGNCDSWYLNPNIGHNGVIWPASSLEYIYHSWSAKTLDYNLK